MPADSAAVEAAKVEQRDRALRVRSATFDEALFEISKEKLKQVLRKRARVEYVSEDSELFQKWRVYVLGQIRLLVDEAIYVVFSTSNVLAGHVNLPGRRAKIVSKDHLVLSNRTSDLVSKLEPELRGRERRKRLNGVNLTVSEVMNTIDWDGHADVFWRFVTYEARPST